MNNLKTYFVFFALMVISHSLSFSEKGVPPLTNFFPNQYHNKGKIWSIKSAPNGIVYLAADRGLLEFDGNNWKGFEGSPGFTRSLLVLNDSVIYSGSDLDFGIWEKDEYQVFHYTSLYPFFGIPSETNEEFWNVFHLDGNILFVSSHNIYVLSNDQFTKISSPTKITGSFLVNGILYFSHEKKELSVLSSYSLKPLVQYPEGIDFLVQGIFKRNDELILVTKDQGLFSLNSGYLTPSYEGLSKIFKETSVFSFEQMGEDFLVFGTIQKGLYIADIYGNVIHHINRHKGLPNNTILSLHFCDSERLWVGMDYGITYIDFMKNIKFFNDFRGDFGTAHTALLKNDVFYLGTNQGLYLAQWSELDNNSEFYSFQFIKGSEGQVWAIESIDNEILVGHDDGLLRVEGTMAKRIASLDGAWNVVPFRDYLLIGNYNGISILEKSDGKWVFKNKMDLIYGSCNQLIVEGQNVLWVNIPNFGIIRALLDQNLNPNERLIIPESDFEGKNLTLFKNNDTIQVLTDKFRYNFCTSKMVFEIEKESSPFSSQSSMDINNLIAITLNRDYDFIPISNGFALKQNQLIKKDSSLPPTLVLRSITSFNNKVATVQKSGDKIQFAQNNIGIEFMVPNRDGVVYQFSVNQKESWSDWSQNDKLEFFGLSQGKYTIHLRAQVDGAITQVLELNFKIAPPWFRTWIAIIFYLLFAGFVAVLFIKYQQKLLRKQRKQFLMKERRSLLQQAEKHRRQLREIEQEKFKEEHDKIKDQLKNKTIELAKKAKDNEDKNRLLLALKEKCEKAKNDPSLSKFKLNEMQRLMDAYLNSDDRIFEIQIDELHQDFFKKLKKRFPDLSSNDLRLCAYLKIGMSSKEISDILNIQPSSIFINRSRLRKKLNLEIEEDLYDFLNRI